MNHKRSAFWLIGSASGSLFGVGLLLVWTASRPSFVAPSLSPAPTKSYTIASPTAMPHTVPASALSLEKVFDNHIETETQPLWKLVVGGDYNPGRHVNVVATNQESFGSLLEHIEDAFQVADIALVNLEGALLHNCPLQSSGMKFCGNSKHAMGLRQSGIDVVSLANNHSLNYGSAGLEETKSILDAYSVQHVGFDDISYLSLPNSKSQIALVGIDATLRSREPHEITQLITTALKQSSLVVPYFHWGSEYTHDPSSHQKKLAHAAVEAGAVLVLGSHPHWVQAVEIFNDTLIVYSHGNLVFDQFWSEKTRQGIIGEYAFSENKVQDARFMPLYIEVGYKPRFLVAPDAARVLEDMRNASERIVAHE
jgi:poly-gamma-glutamate synthesis protein (capsule biosynthesis protein)